MARTILEIAREASEREATAPAPATLFDTNNRVAKILRTAAQDTMREYLRGTNWIGLSDFNSTWAFTLVPGRYAYPLPPDFLRVIAGTEIRNGWPMGLVGPATPQVWAAWLFGRFRLTTPMGWRIRNNALWIDPTPARYELVTIDYISRYPVVSDVLDSDYDMSINPPQITAPFVPRDGQMDLPPESGQPVITGGTGEYDAPPGYDVATYYLEAFEKLKRLSPQSAVAPLAQVRRDAFTADTDRPAFEDDHILSLGMTFRLRRGLGMDYAEVAAEYEAEMEMRKSTDAGGARSFRLGSSSSEWSAFPLGDGRWMVS